MEEVIIRITGSGTTTAAKLDLSPGVQRALENAVEEARKMGHHYIGTEHLLLGLVQLGEGVALDVLRKIGRFGSNRSASDTPGAGGEFTYTFIRTIPKALPC